MIKIRRVLPGKHFTLISVFSSENWGGLHIKASLLHPHFSWEPGLCFCPFHSPWMELQAVYKKEIPYLSESGYIVVIERAAAAVLCFLSCFHTWAELAHVIFVCRMSRVIQSAWHSLLKGSESWNRDAPLKAPQGCSQPLVRASVCRDLAWLYDAENIFHVLWFCCWSLL